MKILFICMALSLVACSSKKTKEIVEVDNTATIKKDYEVRDASSNTRPGWIEQAEEWAAQNNLNVTDSRYFSFETEPKVNREIACNLAKANARADIAGQITTFISKTLGSSDQGSATIDENNPDIQGLRSYTENTLAEKIQAILVGASVEKTYWEKRQYQIKLGAKKDFTGFTCASLVGVKKEFLRKAIEQVQRELEKKTDDPEAKASVKSAIEKAHEEFAKIKS
jgi:carboxypeptidase C (cathepsin A)